MLIVSTVMLTSALIALCISYRTAVQQNRRDVALIAACRRYDADSVVALLKEGANPNARDHRGDMPLWEFVCAKLSGKPILFTSGPTALDVVFESDYILDHPNQPLRTQSFTLRPEPVVIVRELVTKGARVTGNYQDMQGWPLIVYPAQNGWTDSVAVMLDRGANINAKTVNGAMVLSFAVNSRNAMLVKLLIERGVNINARDSQGKTALTDAPTFSTPEIIALLEKAGAKR
jgi:ankyrin repeat protein